MQKIHPSQQFGFTLIELVVTIVVLGIVGVVALGKFQNLSDDAEHAKVDYIFSMVQSELGKINSFEYTLAGSPDNSTYVPIRGINTRYRNGLVRNMQTNAHVPVGTPNRNNQATRFWFLMFEVPPPVIARNDTSSAGWAMYTGNAQCGAGQTRCWKYRRAGTELAVITYRFLNGNLTLVKNF